MTHSTPRPKWDGIDAWQTWPGKRWFDKPGPWCRTKRCMRVAIQKEPYEFFLSLALALFGVRAMFQPETATPGSISGISDAIAILYCAISVTAGTITLTGLLAGCRSLEPGCTPAHEKPWAPGVEMAGLFLSTAAWLCYLVGIVSTINTPRSTLLALALVALALSNVLRARKVWVDQVERLRSLQQVRTLTKT